MHSVRVPASPYRTIRLSVISSLTGNVASSSFEVNQINDRPV